MIKQYLKFILGCKKIASFNFLFYHFQILFLKGLINLVNIRFHELSSCKMAQKLFSCRNELIFIETIVI